MTNKKRKFEKIMEAAEDAELVDKSAIPPKTSPVESAPTEEPPETNTDVPSDEATRNAYFNDAVNQCLNKHKEKGGMAFDILKSLVSNKMDTIIHENDFSKLVAACFSLADVFKLEMDTRWTRDVADISRAIYGEPETAPPADVPQTETPKALETPVEEPATATLEPTITGTETIN